MESNHLVYNICPSVKHQGNDEYTKLLLPLAGSNGATTTNDVSRGNHAIAFHDGATISTAQGKFNGSSLYCGSIGYIASVDSADWVLGAGTGNFTIDFWMYATSDPAYGSIFSQNQVLITDEYRMYVAISKLYFVIWTGGSKVVNLESTWTPTLNTWFHVALIRGWGGNANDWAITTNGVATGTLTDASAVADITAPFSIDWNYGYISEFRISNVARWTADFSAALPGRYF